jgi:predicted ATP-grasp superfamily ATP-dependent carboligase
MRVLLATTATPDDRKTVSCVRALARAGAWVAVGSDRFWGQACYSRFVRRRLRYPHPRHGAPPFIAALNKHVERDRYDVILPMNDYTTLALTRNLEALHPDVATALPPFDSLKIAADKSKTLQLARRLGIETPLTFEAGQVDQLGEIGDRIGYPCVIKPCRGSGAVGFQVLRNRDDLISAYATSRGPSDLAFDHDHLLVQEYVHGETRDACLLYDHGEPVSEFTQRRLRSYPGEGGVGTLVESTRESGLLDRANRLLRALKWHGPAQVEFKVDPDTGRTWLIEVNGRFWGTVDLAVQAGVDFPLLTSRLALGQDVSSSSDYEVGLRYRFPFPFGLLAMGDSGPWWQTAREFFGPERGIRSDVVWSDPLPHLAEALYIGQRAWDRRSVCPSRSRS